MKTTRIVAAFLLLNSLSPVLFAQDQTPAVDRREHRQQQRIKEGVRSGELTPGETRRLEAQEGRIKADEMKAKADGKVTPAERRRLHRELNREGHRIHRMKHNNRTQK